MDVRGNVFVPDDNKQPVSIQVFRFAEAQRFDLHVAVFLQQGLKEKSCKKVCMESIFTTAVPCSRHTRAWGQGEKNETVTPARHPGVKGTLWCPSVKGTVCSRPGLPPAVEEASIYLCWQKPFRNHLEHLTVACVGPLCYFGTANPPMQSPSLSFQHFNESLSKSHLAGVEFGLLLHELKSVLAQGMFK